MDERPLMLGEYRMSAEERRYWANRVRILRERAGMTQQQLADAARVARQTISNVEREQAAGGFIIPQQNTLLAILTALNVNPFLLDDGDRHPVRAVLDPWGDDTVAATAERSVEYERAFARRGITRDPEHFDAVYEDSLISYRSAVALVAAANHIAELAQRHVRTAAGYARRDSRDVALDLNDALAAVRARDVPGAPGADTPRHSGLVLDAYQAVHEFVYGEENDVDPGDARETGTEEYERRMRDLIAEYAAGHSEPVWGGSTVMRGDGSMAEEVQRRALANAGIVPGSMVTMEELEAALDAEIARWNHEVLTPTSEGQEVGRGLLGWVVLALDGSGIEAASALIDTTFPIEPDGTVVPTYGQATTIALGFIDQMLSDPSSRADVRHARVRTVAAEAPAAKAILDAAEGRGALASQAMLLGNHGGDILSGAALAMHAMMEKIAYSRGVTTERIARLLFGLPAPGEG